MDPKTVRLLEDELEQPIAEVIHRLGLRKLPLLPSHGTIQMMAKAAVAGEGEEYRAQQGEEFHASALTLHDSPVHLSMVVAG